MSRFDRIDDIDARDKNLVTLTPIVSANGYDTTAAVTGVGPDEIDLFHPYAGSVVIREGNVYGDGGGMLAKNVYAVEVEQ